MPHSTTRLLITCLLAGGSAIGADAQTENPGPPDNADPSNVEIVVFGSPHLRNMDLDASPIATDVIRSSLMAFDPDLIVVEWLNPAVDRETAFNYRSLGDPATLRRLWGYRDHDAVERAFDATEALLDSLKVKGFSTASTRIELGKLYYLRGDQLNAGYQWWRADRLGANVTDLRRLTRNNFSGHELEVWGFELARRGGHEYVSPFDYQGLDVGSEVWGQLISDLRALALDVVHGAGEGDAEWDELAEAFDTARQSVEEGTSRALLDDYGSVREVREYAAAWDGFRNAYEQTPDDPDGLTRIRWWQGPEYEAIERQVQYDLVPSISIHNLGQARTDGNVRRNEHMADFAELDIAAHQARRVLIIVGYAHKHYLEDIFRERGYTVTPSSQYVP